MFHTLSLGGKNSISINNNYIIICTFFHRWLQSENQESDFLAVGKNQKIKLCKC